MASDNIGYCWLIVGGTGQGKSTFAFETFIKPLSGNLDKLLIHDVNDEYAEYGGTFYDVKEFLEIAENSRGKMIVLEEATIFFGTRNGNEQMRRLLVRKRHQSNHYALLFHSLSDIPKNILRLSNYIVLFKTADVLEDVNSKFKAFPEVVETFDWLKNQEDHSFKIIKLI